jgi:alpha-tubulin suppressor-like RCC1 family protein
MAIYAMGDGWTGALGTGTLTDAFPGHDDEYEEEHLDPPVCVYGGPIKSAAAGWGHSALVTSDSRLLVCGRPHDFSALLRLKRLPAFIRNYAVHHALRYNETGQQADTLAGKVVSWMMGSEDGPEGPWSDAKRNSILPDYIQISMPHGEIASEVVASAGLTAVLTRTGGLYAFGLNHHGQCGVGKMSNNVWTPEPVMGLSSQFADTGRASLEQDHPIQSVALGLQHGLALDIEGNLFVWGKGERGQLGIQEQATLESAKRVIKWRLPSQDGRQQWASDLVVSKIASGLNHAAALTNDNLVFTWGKNVAEPKAQEDKGKPAVDALAPILVKGLPANKAVLDIACGSHHTAILLENGSIWTVGIATDTSRPLFEAVELIPPGMVDLPCSFFGAHFDRTTIIGNDGTQVLQVNLWSDEQLREQAVFTPAWMDHFHDKRIKSVHRGWLHTLIVTKD